MQQSIVWIVATEQTYKIQQHIQKNKQNMHRDFQQEIQGFSVFLFCTKKNRISCKSELRNMKGSVLNHFGSSDVVGNPVQFQKFLRLHSSIICLCMRGAVELPNSGVNAIAADVGPRNFSRWTAFHKWLLKDLMVHATPVLSVKINATSARKE